MTTIKRTIVILILLAIAFFIYRGISPSWAEHLLDRIKAISTIFLGSGTVSSWTEISSPTGQFLELTWDDFVTGSMEETWLIDILSGMDSDRDPWASSLGDSLPADTWSSAVTPTIPGKKTSTFSSSAQWLSSKDIQDTEKLLQNLFQ
jgi:hypothetical protein